MSADKLGQEGVMSQAGQDAINNFANNHPIYNSVYMLAVAMATTLILNADEGWDSQEYNENQKFIANDNLKNILKIPQKKLMNHH